MAESRIGELIPHYGLQGVLSIEEARNVPVRDYSRAELTRVSRWKEKVLYSFQGGSDGALPAGGVVFDKAGNLYGATSDGGSTCLPQECGTVFEVSPPSQKGGAWTESVIYTFQGAFDGSSDGLTPEGAVIIDQQGNLYGTTTLGRNGGCVLLGSRVGCGTVYELSPPMQKGDPWTETILYNFQGGKDGYFPRGDLVFDKQGSLYGATDFGGGKGTTCNIYYGGNCGTVFKLSPPKQKGSAWTEQILHSFAGGTSGKKSGDGADPNGGLIFDSKARFTERHTSAATGAGSAARRAAAQCSSWSHRPRGPGHGRRKSFGALMAQTAAILALGLRSAKKGSSSAPQSVVETVDGASSSSSRPAQGAPGRRPCSIASPTGMTARIHVPASFLTRTETSTAQRQKAAALADPVVTSFS